MDATGSSGCNEGLNLGMEHLLLGEKLLNAQKEARAGRLLASPRNTMGLREHCVGVLRDW